MQIAHLISFLFLAILSVQGQGQSHDASPVVGLPPATFTPRPTSKGSDPLPPCVLACLTNAMQSSGCKTNDQTCACTNPVYQQAAKRCIEASCLPEDQDKAARLQGHCSDLPDDRNDTSSPQLQTPTVINYAEETGRVTNMAFDDHEGKAWWTVAIGVLSFYLPV